MKDCVLYLEGEIFFERLEEERQIDPLSKGLFIIIFNKNKASIFNGSKTKALICVKQYKYIKSKDDILLIGTNVTLCIKNVVIKDKIETQKLSKEKINKELERTYQLKIKQFLIKSNINFVGIEYVLPNGRIDVVGTKGNVYYLFEIKLWELKEKDLDQIKRYSLYFEELGFETKLFLIGRDYTKELFGKAQDEGVTLQKIV